MVAMSTAADRHEIAKLKQQLAVKDEQLQQKELQAGSMDLFERVHQLEIALRPFAGPALDRLAKFREKEMEVMVKKQSE